MPKSDLPPFLALLLDSSYRENRKPGFPAICLKEWSSLMPASSLASGLRANTAPVRARISLTLGISLVTSTLVACGALGSSPVRAPQDRSPQRQSQQGQSRQDHL